MSFCTILHSLKSPQNVGMIVRTHVAYGGSEFIITGNDLPWRFKKGSQAFSRKLENLCGVKHIENPIDTLNWCKSNGYSTVAIEINPDKTVFLDEFDFPEKTAIILGNEALGLDTNFLEQCDYIVTIRQFGDVGSLNVAISASVAMYELNRSNKNSSTLIGNKYYEFKEND